jgi:phage shock protein PspC (stress-responsive transcriptional regulator)
LFTKPKTKNQKPKTKNQKPKTKTMRTDIKLKYFFEKHGFHVSTRLADTLGMRASSVRLFFIYISFVTAGLGFAIYLTLAFWMRLKDLIRAKRSSVFDL